MGITGPTGPTGTGGGGSGEANSFAKTLASGKFETGTWSATIDVPAGGLQTQTQGVISFPIKDAEKPKATYRNFKESGTPKAPCIGNINEPVAEAGNLCVYRGGNFGSLEEEDTNAKFIAFQEPNGEEGAIGGKAGAFVIFRTEEGVFEAGETPIALANPAHLNAAGSWALTAK